MNLTSETSSSDEGAPRLARSLTLTLTVLYGLGVTIGAGIYVLVGVAAGRSGMHAPLAFLLAAVVMAFSAASFAELGTRMPVSASEAAYVQAAFRRNWLSLATGLLVVALQPFRPQRSALAAPAISLCFCLCPFRRSSPWSFSPWALSPASRRFSPCRSPVL